MSVKDPDGSLPSSFFNWVANEKNIPAWYSCFDNISLYLTSSAAQRAGSMFHTMFSEGNMQSLEDYIELSLL